jgi:subtilisin family serine protease
MSALLSAIMIISQTVSALAAEPTEEPESGDRIVGIDSEDSTYLQESNFTDDSTYLLDSNSTEDSTALQGSDDLDYPAESENTELQNARNYPIIPDSSELSDALEDVEVSKDLDALETLEDSEDPESLTDLDEYIYDDLSESGSESSVLTGSTESVSDLTELISPINSQLKEMSIAHNELEAFEELTEGHDYVADEVITLARSQKEAEAIASFYGGELKEYSFGVATISLAGSEYTVGEALNDALDPEQDLPMIEPNYITYIEDPEEGGQIESASTLFSAPKYIHTGDAFAQRWWTDLIRDPYLNPNNDPYQWHHTMINTYSAWGVTTGSEDVLVAVVDSGINTNNIDLTGQVAAGGYDFIKKVELGTDVSNDTNGHGTHVSGIIAAALNDELGAGIAPGVRLLPLQVVNGSSVSNDNIAKAVRYAINAGADIINLSLGGGKYNAVIEQVMKEAYDAGLTVVAAMGNDNASNIVNYPAYYDTVIAVCSVNEEGSLSGFSSYGEWADIAAPGSGIYSCSSSDRSGYRYNEGTSMACPVVTGACALYMSAVGHVDPDTMKAVLRNSVTGSAGPDTGAGILDLAKMFDGDSTAPEILLTSSDGETIIAQVQDDDAHSISEEVAKTATIAFKALNFDASKESNEGTTIVYTTDGTVPCVFDGEVQNGAIYEAPLPVKELLAASADSSAIVTVKAIAVTGMGVVSPASTLTFTVNPNMEAAYAQDQYRLSITDTPSRLVAGKDFKLTAKVISADPYESVSQKVIWTIEGFGDGDLSKARINASTGNLTTNKAQTGTIRIRCTSRATSATATTEFEIVSMNPVGKIVLNEGKQRKLTFNTEGEITSADDLLIKVTTLSDKTGTSLLDDERSYEDIKYLWTSSNTKIFDVKEPAESFDDPGAPAAMLIPRSAGTATLTCKVLDGSAKKASVKVVITSQMKAKSVKLFDSTAAALSSLTMFTDEPWALVNARLEYAGTEDVNILSPIWKSNSTKIARVEVSESDPFSARIIPVSRGIATITCQASDGSGKKATVKITVKQHVEKLTINGPDYIKAGTSAKYTATAAPSNANNKKVTWDNPEKADGITVDQFTGVVKVLSTVEAGSTFTIRAAATDRNGISEEKTVTVTTAWAKKVNAVFAEGDTNTIYINPTETTKGSTRIIATTDNLTEVSFKSSNSKVAVINTEDIYYDAKTGQTSAIIRAAGKGSAKITIAATDGSGKKATLKVNVKELVTSVKVTGQPSIVIGKKATFKTSVLSSKASNRKIRWTLGNDSPKGVSLNGSGVVTVSKNATDAIGKTVTVIATAQDESKESGSVSFTITGKKATGALITVDPSSMMDGVHAAEYTDEGLLSNVRFYNTKFTDNDECNEKQILLTGTGLPEEAADLRFTWNSSNPSVAEVYERDDGKCLVVGRHAGTSTITCTAGDTSGKKASVTVTVISPASSIAIPTAPDIHSDINHLSSLAFGTTCSFTAVLGDLYGEPSVHTVNWDYEIGNYTGSGRFTPLKISEEAKEKQLLFTFTDGTLTIKDRDSYIEDLEELGETVESGGSIPYYAVKITASTTDGTGYEAVKYVKAAEPVPEVFVVKNDEPVSSIELPLSEYRKEDGTMDKTNPYEAGVLKQFVDEAFAEYPSSVKLSVVSSDTNVVTPQFYIRSGTTERVLRLYPTGPGTATVTVKAKDGSGRNYVFTVTIQ